MISIIIPAHNEEKVIGLALDALLPGVIAGEIQVIVVCNGCNDHTAGVVASYGRAFRCFETPVPSKTGALNIGDAAASGFPRIYQDADVVLSVKAAREIAEVLRAGQYLAAAPKMRMEYGHASWAVRSYYDVWQQLPYVREGMIGTGVYALSEAGRQRFDKFPQIIADDGYIRAIFKACERTSVDTCYSVVQAPANLKGLLIIKTRSRLGRYELARKFPELLENEEKDYGSAICGWAGKVGLWPKVAVYLYVNLVSRYLAKRNANCKGIIGGWERDESSRNNAGNVQ